MNKKKIFNLIGVIVGVATIILGVVFVFTPADSYRTSTPDDVTFGADYYTYEYEATRIAASNAAVTANNIRELTEKLALYFGCFFIIFGLLILIYFLKEFFGCEASVTNNTSLVKFSEAVEPKTETNEPEIIGDLTESVLNQ